MVRSILWCALGLILVVARSSMADTAEEAAASSTICGPTPATLVFDAVRRDDKLVGQMFVLKRSGEMTPNTIVATKDSWIDFRSLGPGRLLVKMSISENPDEMRSCEWLDSSQIYKIPAGLEPNSAFAIDVYRLDVSGAQNYVNVTYGDTIRELRDEL